MIDEIYFKEKKLERKCVEREDYVASQKLIFDLTKANKFDAIRNEGVVSETEKEMPQSAFAATGASPFRQKFEPIAESSLPTPKSKKTI